MRGGELIFKNKYPAFVITMASRFVTKRSTFERRALDAVMKAGKDGILQTELWKRIEVSSREGSRICLRLEKWGLIRRERFLNEGRWTYKIFSTKAPLRLDSILGAPCITCPYFYQCAPGGEISPEKCVWLDEWVLTSES